MKQMITVVITLGKYSPSNGCCGPPDDEYRVNSIEFCCILFDMCGNSKF